MATIESLKADLERVLEQEVVGLTERLGELTLVVKAGRFLDVCHALRDEASLRFDTLIDLCGLDFRDYGDGSRDGLRFAAVLHLLSVHHNHRLRLRVLCEDDDFPVLASVTGVWPAAGWFEREAFDLFGIVFEGHPDLRRILTDYGFVGHPFRKDFPVYGLLNLGLTLRIIPVNRLRSPILKVSDICIKDLSKR